MLLTPPQLEGTSLQGLPDPIVEPHRFLAAASTHGDVVGYRVGSQDRVLVAHPEDAHEVLTAWPEEARWTPITRTAATIIGDGLITAGAPNWRPRRLVIQRELSFRNVRRFAERIAGNTDDQLSAWAAAGRVELQQVVGRLTLDNLGDTVFGADFSDFRETLVEALRTSQLSIDAVLEERYGDAERAAMEAAAQRLEAIVQRLVAAHRIAPTSGADLLRVLIESADSGDPAFRDPWLVDEAVTIIMAGHETTALTVTMALYLLATNPDVQERLRSELQDAVTRGVPTSALADEVALSRHVIQETLRLFPPLPALHRMALSDTAVRGYRISQGTMVVTSPWVIQHDERWWPEPQRFDPDRWLDERRKTHVRYAYVPFGAGSRICAGNHFALLEAATIVALATLRLRLDGLADTEPVLVDQGTALRCAHPLMVDVESVDESVADRPAAR